MKLSLLTLDNSLCGGCSVLCRMFTNILDICPLDASSNLPVPGHDQKCLQTLQMCAGEMSLLPIESHCSKPNHPCSLAWSPAWPPSRLTGFPGFEDLCLTFQPLRTRVIFRKVLPLSGLMHYSAHSSPKTSHIETHPHASITKLQHPTLAQKTS